MLENDNKPVQRKMWHVWEKERLNTPLVEKSKRILPIEHVTPEPKSIQKVEPTLLPLPRQQQPQYYPNEPKIYPPPPQQYMQSVSPRISYVQQPAFVLPRHNQTMVSISPHDFYQQQQRQQFIERQQQYMQQEYNRYYNKNNFY